MKALVRWLFVRLSPQSSLDLVLEWAKEYGYTVEPRKPSFKVGGNVVKLPVAIPRPALPMGWSYDRSVRRAESLSSEFLKRHQE